jgi:hypothetical protein
LLRLKGTQSLQWPTLSKLSTLRCLVNLQQLCKSTKSAFQVTLLEKLPYRVSFWLG